MDYLLTWVDGEEVLYRLVARKELPKLKVEDDRPCSLTELRTCKEIEQIREFIDREKRSANQSDLLNN